jgi:peptidoglycan-associated lipoprotein
MKYATLSIAWLASIVSSSCTSNPSKPAEEPRLEPASGPIAREAAEDDEDPGKSTVTIDPRLVELCNMPVPKFAFDSSALSDQARNALDTLATCLVSGPAAGQVLRLIGHADPRGTDEYNMALGQRRAASVAGHLQSRSVEQGRLETSSRGELDATGTDEPSWALDRKVEIYLAD